MVSLFLRSVDKIVYGDCQKIAIRDIFIEGSDSAEQQINEVYLRW